MRPTLVSAHERKNGAAWRLSCIKIFAGEKDLVIIGGGVAGYVAAIKAGQEGLKVTFSITSDAPLQRAECSFVVITA